MRMHQTYGFIISFQSNLRLLNCFSPRLSRRCIWALLPRRCFRSYFIPTTTLLMCCDTAMCFAIYYSQRSISFSALCSTHFSREVFKPLASSSQDQVAEAAIHNSFDASEIHLLIYTSYSHGPEAEPAHDNRVGNDFTAVNLSSPISHVTSFAVLDRYAFQQMIDEALATYSIDEDPRACSFGKTLQHSTTGEHSPGDGRSSDGSESSLPTVTVIQMRAPNHLTRELHRLLRKSECELYPLLKVQQRIDAYVDRIYYPLLVYTFFAFFVLHFVVYFNWIFFVFDWNLVEPTTYFLGHTGVFFALVFHYMRCDVSDEEYTHKNFLRFIAERRRGNLYKKEQLKEGRILELKALVEDIKRELQRS